MARKFTFKGVMFSGLLAAAGALMVAPAAHATPVSTTLTDQGITYTLTETTTASPLTALFTLNITGINSSATAAYDGRYGFDAVAFGTPSNFASASGPSGFTYQSGGLNANGCSGNGAFFCFSANTAPSATIMAPNSSLTFNFSVTLSSGTFANYTPDLKIDWVGTQNNYDLVSQNIAPTVVSGQQSGGTSGSQAAPEPATLTLIGSAVAGLAAARRRRRSR